MGRAMHRTTPPSGELIPPPVGGKPVYLSLDPSSILSVNVKCVNRHRTAQVCNYGINWKIVLGLVRTLLDVLQFRKPESLFTQAVPEMGFMELQGFHMEGPRSWGDIRSSGEIF